MKCENDLINKVTCPQCKKEYTKSDLRRNCSNCFACTGCEIYICYNCRGRIVVKPPRELKSRK